MPLRRGPGFQVSVEGVPRPATSPALAAQLTTVIDDRTRTARVHVGPATKPEHEIGAFPGDETTPTQHVFIDQVVALDRAVPGAGAAKLAHEITENFVAQPLIAAGGPASSPSHRATQPP